MRLNFLKNMYLPKPYAKGEGVAPGQILNAHVLNS